MNAQASNTVIVNVFTTPERMVKLTDVRINAETLRFVANIQLGTESGIWSVPEEISGTITVELKKWLTLIKDEKYKVKADNDRGFEYVKSGRRLTSFQRFLEKSGFESLASSPDMLSSLEFECSNTSENYMANPFRIVRRIDGKCTMTLVNLPSKKRVETVNEETGEHTVYYTTKYGKFASGEITKAFINPSKYRRFIYEESVTKELFQD